MTPRILAAVTALLLAGPAFAQSAADQLRARALSDTSGYALVEELTTRFGARPAGSPSEQAAASWGAEQLRRFGFTGSAVEPFPIKRWEAGSSSVQVLGANPQQLVVTPLGGVTGRKAEGDAVLFRTYAEFLESDPAAARGKVVVVLEKIERRPDGSGYSRAIPIRTNGPGEAARRGAVGYLMRSLNTERSRTASSGASNMLPGAFPAFALSPPDAEQLERLAKIGPVRLRLASTAGWKGSGTSRNVVAEIPGRDPSAGPILVSAHLDSWEQGTGAVDNGFGVAAVTAAARLIRELPAPPRRPIRIVWWGAEEVSQPAPVGVFPGARAYAERHRAELPALALVAESDGGAGKVTELSVGIAEHGALIQALKDALAPLGVKVTAAAPRMGGPDISVLQGAGAPAFKLTQDASAQYDTHHNANDVLDEIDPAALRQNIAAWAVSLWLLADSEAEFGRPAAR